MIKNFKLKKISNSNCDLIYFNKIKKIINNPERIFFLNAKKNCVRGNHAHKLCTQYFFCLNGNVKINIDNGKKDKFYNLKFGSILKIKPLNWVKVNLKKNQTLCVVCDKEYSEKEYIRSYSKFKKITNKV